MQCGFGFCVPGRGVEIQEFAVGRQCLEPVGESLGNDDGIGGFSRQHHAMPLILRWRIGTDINRDIENGSPQTRDDLQFRMGWPLEMHSANHSRGSSERAIHLNDRTARSEVR